MKPTFPGVLTVAALSAVGPAIAAPALVLTCSGARTQDAAFLCADVAAELEARGFAVSRDAAEGRRIELVTEQLSATELRAQVVVEGGVTDDAGRLTLSVAGRGTFPREEIRSFAGTLIEMSGLLSR